jgi:hypothetical protein
VAESGIITLDLSTYIPDIAAIASFDLQPYLFHGMILREKDYRAALLALDWESFRDKVVALYCSTDAIIPVWAYMLAASNLAGYTRHIYWGAPSEAQKQHALKNIAAINQAELTDKRVILKGCGDTPVPEWAYVAATAMLQPIVKSLMYGEPCSTVPVYKKSLKAA